jgi:hypothetical protein
MFSGAVVARPSSRWFEAEKSWLLANRISLLGVSRRNPGAQVSLLVISRGHLHTHYAGRERGELQRLMETQPYKYARKITEAGRH